MAAHNKLDHIAFGVPDVAAVVPLLVSELGGHERGVGPGHGFRFWQWEYAGGGAIEILVPAGPPGGFLHRFLDARGAGPHHVTYKVPDIQVAMKRANELGYDIVGFDDSDPGWIEAFLHPKQAQGIVVQLSQAAEWDGPGPDPAEFPPLPATRPEAARVVGLRLSASSEARARTQWESLLQGHASREAGAVVYRWDDSPLRIAVEADPERAEGPIALEVCADRPLALPPGPHPVLGLPIVQIEAPSA